MNSGFLLPILLKTILNLNNMILFWVATCQIGIMEPYRKSGVLKVHGNLLHTWYFYP